MSFDLYTWTVVYLPINKCKNKKKETLLFNFGNLVKLRSRRDRGCSLVVELRSPWTRSEVQPSRPEDENKMETLKSI